MEVRFYVPEGYWLEGFSYVRPEGTWRAYLRTQVPYRSNQLGTFRGAVGRTPQEAIDRAQAAIEESLRAQAAYQPERKVESTLTVDDLDF